MTKAERLEAEIKRTELMKEFDREYKIYGTICGIDEAGRGPLCGPVVAAAVILPDEYNILYINDSKQRGKKYIKKLINMRLLTEWE